jgi:formate dehydrogenase major subunit
MNYWSNYPKFFVSLMKAWYGASATKDNDFCFDWLPKNDKLYDILAAFELMHEGKMNGYFCQGFNAIASIPDKQKVTESLSKLKYLVIIDPLATDTSTFFQPHGEFHDVDPKQIATEVFRLPSTCFAEENGSLVNSGRWLQWHFKAADPPGEAKGDEEIIAEIFVRLRDLYAREGGVFAEPILGASWPYVQPRSPSPEELAKEYNGVALVDVADPKDSTKVLVHAGEQLSSFAQLQADGSTAAGCWIFTGCFTQAGNQMARRDTADPSGLGVTPGWAWAWPANRRLLYNRASAAPDGSPWDGRRAYMRWDGHKWTGPDIPDFPADGAPAAGMSPFIMNADGVGHLFAYDGMADGPFPEHYEPFETPLAKNPLNGRVLSNPAARVYPADRERMGAAAEFPFVATTYRLTEHFHFWTKHASIPAILQPEAFVEIGEGLAKERGIASGDMVVVRSKRGQIKVKALVTKRIRPLTVDGKEVHTVGLPFHWGYEGVAKPSYLVNTLTPFVGDANVQTPEFKAFLVDVRKA